MKILIKLQALLFLKILLLGVIPQLLQEFSNNKRNNLQHKIKKITHFLLIEMTLKEAIFYKTKIIY